MSFTEQLKKERRPERVLLVDDQSKDLYYNKERLEKAGYEVITCLINRHESDDKVDIAIQYDPSEKDAYEQVENAFKEAIKEQKIDILVTDGMIGHFGEHEELPLTGKEIIDWVQATKGDFVKGIVSTDALDPEKDDIGVMKTQFKSLFPNAVNIVGKFKTPKDDLHEAVRAALSAGLEPS